MTLFAVACAGMFPILHLGRPWLAYWLMPVSQHHVAVAAAAQPADLGCVRGFHLCHRIVDVLVHGPGSGFGHHARPRRSTAGRKCFRHACARAGAVRRSTGPAIRWPTCCWPALATPLVVSVHTVVSFDFAVAILPGWHTTIFPPYFVAGAIYSGFAMVLTLAIPGAPVVSPGRSDHHAAYGCHGQGDAGHRPDCRLRVSDGRLSWPGTAAISMSASCTGTA